MMFNFTFFIFSITILFLIVAVIYDVRKRIIPNPLVLTLLIIGIITKIIQSIVLNNLNILLNSLLSFAVTFFVSYVLWETGFFAGGDLKLFSALAVLNPFNLNFFASSLSFGIITHPFFVLTLIIVSILSTAPVLIIHSLYLFIFRKHHFILWDILKSKNTIFSFISSVLVLFLISSFLHIFSLTISFLFYFLFSIAFLLFFRQLEKYNVKFFYYIITIFYLLLIASAIFFKLKIFSFYNLLTIIITIKVLFLAITIYKIISTRILVEKKKIYELKEGDVVWNNYYKINNKVIEKKVTFFGYFKQIIKNTYSNNLVLDSKKIGGLSSKDITFLKSSYKHNLEKEVLLKRTLPFTPSVFFAYILLNVLGDFIWMFF